MSQAPSYVHGTSATPLLGETLGQNLRRTVERHGDREALVVVSQGYRATYRELWDMTTQVAKGLLAMGVEKGDRVGLWSPNRFEWVVTQYATARIGAILVNLNPAYRTAALELDDDWQLLLSNAKHVSEHTLEDREASLQFDDPINIQYTSGTTGFPKGATLSHHNVLNNGYFIGEALKYGPQDRVCIPVPFYHCFGMVIGNLACTSHGATMVIPGEAFDPLAVLQTVQAEKCTSLYGVPTMFIAELDHPRFGEFDLTTLRTGVMAGSPCPVEVMKQVQSRMNMREVTICYGMTETSPVSTQSSLDDPFDKRVSTVGRVHPHLEVKVINAETGAVVPRGAAGELCTRGYSVMLGYWANEEATAKAVDAAGWMHTGDLATMDAEGYVRIVGRIKDLIIRGGENISPREVEEFLHTHPGVSEAQVIGVPSVKYGEEVMAWVKPKPGVTLTPEELTKHCTGRIASFKVPRHWKLVDGFPMTVTGKVQKFRMREVSVAELGLEAASSIKTA